MKRLAVVALMITVALPALAQSTSAPAQDPNAQAAPPAGAPPPPPPPTSRPPLHERFFFGGGIGLNFGEVDYVEVAPLVGFQFNPKLSAGLQLLYRWRNDGRFSPSLTSTDYGASLFGRFNVTRALFVQAEGEYLSYELPPSDGDAGRDSYLSFLVGPGFFQSMGRHGGLYTSLLYNLSYDANDLYSPYQEPWVFRVGVSFGF